jgi:hypothetical protein
MMNDIKTAAEYMSDKGYELSTHEKQAEFARKRIKSKPAKSQRGYLIRGLGDKIWFRQYNENFEFIDYDITHFDCEIEILESDAVLIESPEGNYLDYNHEV